MKEEKLLADLEREDLPEDLREVSDVIGLEAVRLLIAHFQGERVHIPFPRNLDSLVHRFVIRENEAGASHRQIARWLGMQTRYVKKLLSTRNGANH